MDSLPQQAAILFDKLHIMRHLREALDKVRKSEYARLSGKDRCPSFTSPQRSGRISISDTLGRGNRIRNANAPSWIDSSR